MDAIFFLLLLNYSRAEDWGQKQEFLSSGRAKGKPIFHANLLIYNKCRQSKKKNITANKEKMNKKRKVLFAAKPKTELGGGVPGQQEVRKMATLPVSGNRKKAPGSGSPQHVWI